MSSPDIGIEEGWTTLETGFRNAESYIFDQVGFVSTDDYTSLYSVMYRMCTQKPPNNWSENLYQNYCEAIKDYLSSRILPHIKEKHDESML